MHKYLFCLAPFVSFLLGTLVLNGNLMQRLLIAAAFFLITSSLLLRKRKGIIANPFHPCVFLKVLVFFGLFGGLVEMSFNQRDLFEKYFYDMYFYFLSFLISIEIFSFAFPQTFKNYYNYNRSLKTNPLMLFYWVYVVSVVWRVFSLSNGLLYGTFLGTQLEITKYANLFGSLNQIGLISFFAIIIFYQDKLPRGFVFFVIIEMVWAFASGSKAAPIYVLVPVLFIFMQKGYITVNKKFIFSSLFIVIFIVVLFKIVPIYRGVIQYNIQTKDIENVNMNLYVCAFKESILKSSESKLIVPTIFNRINWAKNFALLLDQDSLNNFAKWHGESLIPIFVWFIPRIIWPEKPFTSVGSWYGKAILGWDYDSRSEGAITLWGDGYMNFGSIGAFLFPIVWCFFLYFFYYFSIRWGTWGLLLYSSCLVRIFLGIEQNFANPIVAIQNTFIIVGLFWIVCQIIFLKPRRL